MKLKPYPKYKESGVQWIGEIPEDWEINKFKRIAFYQEGPGLRNWQFTDEGIKVICVTNITLGGISFADYVKYISFDEYKLMYKHFTVQKGDLLLSSSGASWGKIAEYNSNEKVILNTSTIRINQKRGEKISNYYIKYYLNSKSVQDHLGLLLTGSCQPNFGPSHLDQLFIIYPKPTLDQSKIATFLNNQTSQLNQTIEADKKLIELLKEKRTALINHVVTKGLNPKAKMKDSGIEWIGEVPERWEVNKLKYSCIINKKTLGEETNPSLKINYLDISNVNNTGSIVSTEELYFEDAPSRARRVPDQQDTIISTVRTYLKAIAYLDNIPNRLIVSTGFAVLHADKLIIPKYLFYVSSSENFIQKVIADSTGVAYPAINPSDLGQIKIIIPTKPEQIQIVEYLNKSTSKIDQTIQKIEEKIELLEEFKKSLIHHVVTGKVDVRA